MLSASLAPGTSLISSRASHLRSSVCLHSALLIVFWATPVVEFQVPSAKEDLQWGFPLQMSQGPHVAFTAFCYLLIIIMLKAKFAAKQGLLILI